MTTGISDELDAWIANQTNYTLCDASDVEDFSTGACSPGLPDAWHTTTHASHR